MSGEMYVVSASNSRLNIRRMFPARERSTHTATRPRISLRERERRERESPSIDLESCILYTLYT